MWNVVNSLLRQVLKTKHLATASFFLDHWNAQMVILESLFVRCTNLRLKINQVRTLCFFITDWSTVNSQVQVVKFWTVLEFQGGSGPTTYKRIKAVFHITNNRNNTTAFGIVLLPEFWSVHANLWQTLMAYIQLYNCKLRTCPRSPHSNCLLIPNYRRCCHDCFVL